MRSSQHSLFSDWQDSSTDTSISAPYNSEMYPYPITYKSDDSTLPLQEDIYYSSYPYEAVESPTFPIESGGQLQPSQEDTYLSFPPLSQQVGVGQGKVYEDDASFLADLRRSPIDTNQAIFADRQSFMYLRATHFQPQQQFPLSQNFFQNNE